MPHERHMKAASEQQAHALLTKNLRDFREEELSFDLLHALFWHHQKNGDAQLQIGELMVNKRIHRHRNSGNDHRDYEVSFSWVSGSGETRIVRQSDCCSPQEKSRNKR